MKIKLIKIFVILTIVLTLMSSTAKAFSLDDVITQGKSFLSSGTNSTIEESGLQDLSSTVYNVLLVIGVVMAVIVVTILGIKFMIGSAEQKADIKGAMIPFIIGCIVVFGAFGIWKAIVLIIQSTGI